MSHPKYPRCKERSINTRGLKLPVVVIIGGAIYNLEGLGSNGSIVRGMAAYGASKRALAHITDSIAGERFVAFSTSSPTGWKPWPVGSWTRCCRTAETAGGLSGLWG